MTKWTNLYVANRTIAEIAAGNPKILFGASIHPYRPDWQAELDYCLDHKAVLCKWLPSAQCIDPSHPKCIPFYEALAAHNLPLLCHVGPEASIPTWDKSFEKFNNALYLKPALERGVPVIFAHCSLPFEPASLGQDDVFQQFLSVMRAAKNNNYGSEWQAYADISALCLLRSSYVPYLLSNIDSSRFLFGSDYPIPMMDLSYKKVPSIWDWIKHFWETLAAKNRLDKNYLLLEDMGFPPEVFSAAERLFNKITYV
jgi:predicted TIM-barrel fold metal-dependent hydrolase